MHAAGFTISHAFQALVFHFGKATHVRRRPVQQGRRTMSEPRRNIGCSWSPALARRIEQACTRFEAAWKAGQQPPLEEFLRDIAEPERSEILRELLSLVLDYCSRNDQRPDLEEYLLRFAQDVAVARGRFPQDVPSSVPWPNSSDDQETVAATRAKATAEALNPTGPYAVAGAAEGERSRQSAASLPCIPGYQILGVLGQGGMGMVYKAQHLRLNRPVALKTILAKHQLSEDALARFLLEAQAVARLHHPHIVQIHDIGECGDVPYFCLEFVDGGSLDKKLAGTPQPPRAAAELVETLARAMHHAHQCQVVHRDLKPANILLQRKSATPAPKSEIRNPKSEKDGGLVADFGFRISDLGLGISEFDPKVTDFGLAKQLDSDQAQTKANVILGTASYMAPEQAAGKSSESDPLVDVYALGAILYEMLAGRPPFKGATWQDTLEQVRTQEPVHSTRLQPKVPRDLDTICLKCLEKEPGKRYGSALALADDLRRFLDHQPILARPARVWERTLKWARRRPAVAALGGALIGISVLAFVLVTWELAVVVNARHETEGLRREAERSLTLSYLDRALTRLNQGDTGRGMLWLAHTLGRVKEDWFSEREADDLRRAIRANLAAWRGRVQYLQQVVSHPGPIRSAVFSPDGKKVLTVGDDGRARLWAASRGKMVERLLEDQKGHQVLSATFGSTSRLLMVLTQGPGNRSWLWVEKEPGGRPLSAVGLRQIPGGAEIPAQVGAISPDGRFVATADGNTVHLWKAATGELISTGRPAYGTRALAFSGDGKYLAFGGEDKMVWVCDTAMRKKPNACKGPGEGGPAHGYAVRALAFSPDGKLLASGSEDQTVRFWKAATGKRAGNSLVHQDAVQALAFSGDGQRLLAGGDDGTATLWNVSTAKPVGPPLEHEDAVQAVAFSPIPGTVLTAGQGGSVRLWKTAGERSFQREYDHHGDKVMAAALSPNRKAPLLVTAGSHGCVRAWNVETAQPLSLHGEKHTDDVWAVAFSPNGHIFATGSRDGTVKIWDANARKVLHTLLAWDNPKRRPAQQRARARRRVRALAFSPDGTQLLIGGGGFERSGQEGEGKAVLWEVGGKGPARRGWPVPRREIVWQVAFSPGERTKMFAVASARGTVRLWKRDKEKLERLGALLRHRRRVNALAFSSDGRFLLTGSIDKTAQLWDARTGERVGKPLRHPGAVWAAAFIDAHTVATGCRDGAARLWDVRTGIPIGPPLRHGGTVWALAYSPGGKALVTGSEDKRARLWQISTPVKGRVERITRWVQVMTALELDDHRATQPLNTQEWEERRRRLEELGGPPMP
jgi:WD40 repeat protein/serine/threonine protein kinase